MQVAAAILLLCATVSAVWPQARSEEELWAPIRITPVYNSSISRYSQDTQRLIKNVLIPAVTQWFSEAFQVRRTRTNILLTRACLTGTQISEGDDYCQTSCASITMCGPVRVPESHLLPCRICDTSGFNCAKTGGVQAIGVNNSDFILYVSGLDYACSYSDQLLYGGHCQQESQYDRPIAGFLNFCPAIMMNGSSFDHTIGLVFHELVHTLVFSKKLLSYYRDEQGLPRTRRSSTGKPDYVNGQHIIDASTLAYITPPAPWTSSASSVGMIVTPKVVKAVAEHFNCSTLLGAQLENQAQGVETNWEKSLFGNEVMTASLYEYFVVSKVTLALFEDSGWYRVDYQYAQSLDWGRGRGCGFVYSNCRNWLQNARSQDLYPYCTDSDWHGNHHRCVNSWKAVGDCGIKNYTNPLRYKVLPPNLGGTDLFTDYCPMYQADNNVGKNCKQPSTQISSLSLEVYGPQSFCMTLSKPWTSVNRQGTMTTQMDWGAGCYQVTCNSSQVMVTVGNKVIPCVPGMIKEVNVTIGSTTCRGGVVCPTYEDVCAGFNCYKRCSGNGQCSINGYCLCNPGYFGDDCSRRFLEGLQSCSNITCFHGAQCQDTPIGARCVCSPGFTGTLCDVVTVTDPCALQPCGGRGLCFRTNEGQTSKCHCYRGYSGTFCQDTVDYCAGVGMTCVHGQCANDSSPHCTCPPGYSGVLCDRMVDRCAALKPCKNGGLCINMNNSTQFQCRCPIGFKGKICKILDLPCPPGVCNGSRCYVAGSNHSVCACMEPSCDLTWVRVCPPSTCQNGGRCVWNGLTNQCLCTPGTAGVSCTLRTTSVPSFLGNGYLVVPMAIDNSTNYTITISVKPDGPDGLIFYWEGPSSFLLLRLQGHSLLYRIGNTGVLGGGAPVMVEVTDTGILEPGRWHSITMLWSSISCALDVTNGNTTRSIPCPNTMTTPFTLGTHAFIGGHTNLTAPPISETSGFVGCVSHLEVNGSPVNITPGGAGHNVFQCGAAGPCGTCGGVCRSGPAEGYWCECEASEGGALCDEVLSSSPAFNRSYLLLPLTSQPLNNITITLTSHIASGLLLLLTATPTASGSYLSITLDHGNITVETYLVSGESWMVTLPLIVAIGTRQDVVMVFRGGALKNINKNRVVGGAPYVLGDSLLMYMGGVSPWQLQAQWKWWSGCVQKVMVNGQDVSMATVISSMNIRQCT